MHGNRQERAKITKSHPCCLVPGATCCEVRGKKRFDEGKRDLLPERNVTKGAKAIVECSLLLPCILDNTSFLST